MSNNKRQAWIARDLQEHVRHGMTIEAIAEAAMAFADAEHAKREKQLIEQFERDFNINTDATRQEDAVVDAGLSSIPRASDGIALQGHDAPAPIHRDAEIGTASNTTTPQDCQPIDARAVVVVDAPTEA